MILLNPAEIAELTDIRTGRDGKTREQRQVDALRKMKIPYFVSSAGRPKVSRAAIEGGTSKEVKTQETWSPSLA